MPVFQYFGWVGSFLLATLLAANWCLPAPIAPHAGVPLDQKIKIRIHTDHKWPERVVFDTAGAMVAQKAGVETAIGGSVFDRPARPARPQSRRTRGLGKLCHLKSALALRRARTLLSPVGFTSRQEKADAFARESG